MKLRSDLILREMGGEYVIVDPNQDVVDMSKVFTLNETAAHVWRELTDIEFTKETIADILTNNYDVEFSQAIEDAEYLLTTFSQEGLIEG